MRIRGNAWSATFHGIVDRVRNRAPELPLDDAERLDGKTALVTGSNRGLGLGIAQALVGRGARVVAACRSGLDQLGARLGASADPRPLDLADLASVERLIDSLARDRVALDVVVFNAGVVAREARVTRDRLDETFQVNFLANVLLARRLFEHGLLRAGARLVFVSSELHRSAPPIDFARLGAARSWGLRQAVAEYGASKLLVETWAHELARRARAAAVHTMCPGAVDTDVAREAPEWSKPLLAIVMRAFFQRPGEAARPVVFLAASRTLDGETGVYLHARRRKERGERARDPAAGARLWDESERLLAAAGHALAPFPVEDRR